MKNSIYQKLQDNDFIDWGVLYMGWTGIIARDVEDKSLELLIENKASDLIFHLDNQDSQFISAAILCDLSHSENDDITEGLRSLAINEKINFKISERKWRVTLLEKLIEDIKLQGKNAEENVVDNLIQLQDFWQSWHDEETVLPIKIQGVNNNIGPVEYYTVPMLEEMIAQCEEWAGQEKLFLQMANSISS